jgi:selenocysteine-specific elongation factor
MAGASQLPPLTLGTAGHIDHGKTALIRALTGRDTDRLPEERERGISIELGYALLELPSGRRLSVVDVPGHERFVRTMVAGASGIDLYLLCVAADDGVMPQTREHLAVLRQLGVERGVAAITKADLLEPGPALAEVRELLPGVDAVGVSAREGMGLDELLAALDRVAAELPGRAAASDGATAGVPARLHVDRSFTLHGIGTVVTGTLWSGSLGAGDRVAILPAGREARVRSVHVHDQPVERAGAGQRVALAIAGVDRREIARGDVVVSTPATELSPTFLIDAVVTLEDGARPLRRGARVHVHHGTREAPARVAPLGSPEPGSPPAGDAIGPGAAAFAQLRLEAPLVPAAGDRLVLRQLAPPDTIGGGEVLDPHPRKHGPRPEVVERLRAIASGAAAGPGAGAAAARAAAADPGPAGKAAARAAAADSAPAGRAAARAAAADSARAGTAPGRAAPGQDSAPALDAAALRLAALLHADGAAPRADGDLAVAAGLDPPEAARHLRALERAGRIARVARNLHFDPGALEALTARIVAICERDGAATIAGVRDELGTSRRYAQALLEHLDAEKVTIRRGDAHVLRRVGRT